MMIVLDECGIRVTKLSEYMVPWMVVPSVSLSCNLLKKAILPDVFLSVTSILPSGRSFLASRTFAAGISCRDSKPEVHGPVTV